MIFSFIFCQGTLCVYLYLHITTYTASTNDEESLVERDQEGATAMPIFCPTVVEGEQAVEAALSSGKFPVVDKLVDVFAVSSAPGQSILLRMNMLIAFNTPVIMTKQLLP